MSDAEEIPDGAVPRPPKTKEECLEQALRWGSTLSHCNEIAQLASDNATAVALCAQADAAEVARLSALYSMLPAAAEAAASETHGARRIERFTRIQAVAHSGLRSRVSGYVDGYDEDLGLNIIQWGDGQREACEPHEFGVTP